MERHCCAFLLRLDVGSVCIGQAVRISSGVYPDYRFFMKRRGASAAFLPFKNTLDKLSIAYIMYIYNLMGVAAKTGFLLRWQRQTPLSDPLFWKACIHNRNISAYHNAVPSAP